MRIVISGSVFLAMTCVAIAQENRTQPSVSSVVGQMKATTWSQRSDAFDQAVKLLDSAETTKSDVDRLRLSIVQLLIHENNGGLKEPDNVGPENYNEGYGEDKAEYYAGLISFVAEINDERAIPALLGAGRLGWDRHPRRGTIRHEGARARACATKESELCSGLRGIVCDYANAEVAYN